MRERERKMESVSQGEATKDTFELDATEEPELGRARKDMSAGRRGHSVVPAFTGWR